MSNLLAFDEPSHTYRVNGQVVPSVTQVLDKAFDSYARVPKNILDAAAAKGNYVHKACELLLWDQLDKTQIDSTYIKYIEAFERFLDESGVEIEAPEERLYHPQLGYAGTVDLIAKLPIRKKYHRAIVDYKTSFKLMPSVGPQLAAYQEAFNHKKSADEKARYRFALHLKKDGSYELESYESPMDLAVFKSCLTLHKFVQENK